MKDRKKAPDKKTRKSKMKMKMKRCITKKKMKKGGAAAGILKGFMPTADTDNTSYLNNLNDKMNDYETKNIETNDDKNEHLVKLLLNARCIINPQVIDKNPGLISNLIPKFDKMKNYIIKNECLHVNEEKEKGDGSDSKEQDDLVAGLSILNIKYDYDLNLTNEIAISDVYKSIEKSHAASLAKVIGSTLIEKDQEKTETDDSALGVKTSTQENIEVITGEKPDEEIINEINKTLPTDWETVKDTVSNSFYYHNTKTGETTWDKPVRTGTD